MADKYPYDLQPIKFRKINPQSALHEGRESPFYFLRHLSLTNIFPILAKFRTMDKEGLKSDAMAGLLIGAFLIPQGMAYATVAGMRIKSTFESCLFFFL